MRTLHQPLHHPLHLQHRRHTGRLLHRKHTSYRGLAVIIGLAAVLMVGLNMMARATADTIVVYAQVHAPTPLDAAVILSPSDGLFTSDSNVGVSGTCPAMSIQLVIGILDNGALAGSTPCKSDDTFFVPITVTPGRHVLVARTYNVTMDSGPDSSPVTITYVAPTAVPTGGAPSDNLQSTITPIVITIDEPFITFGPAKDAIWLGTITGGTLPYRVHIDWGDGSQRDYIITHSGKQHFAHHYRSMQPHPITLRVTDATGRSMVRHYVAVTPYISPLLSVAPRSPWKGSTPLGIYGAYLLLLVVFGGLWVRNHRSRQFAYARAPAQHAGTRRTSKARTSHKNSGR